MVNGRLAFRPSLRTGDAQPLMFEARMHAFEGEIVPGAIVRHPTEPDWGRGQVQSVVGQRITVNFEHRGKVLINAAVVSLALADDED